MAALAICGTINAQARNDPAYRYKMPPIVTKHEGRGNGSKTCIVNCAEVAAALHRTPGALTKFFGNELGCVSKWDGLRSIVNGHQLPGEFPKLLDKFIDLFVLCPNCKLPETRLSVQARKNGNIYHKCASCGAKSLVDMSHKLCTFIIKDAMAAKLEDAKDKKKKKKKKSSSDDKDAKKSKKDKKDKKKKKNKKKKSKKDAGSDEDSDAASDGGEGGAAAAGAGAGESKSEIDSDASFGEAQLGDDGAAEGADDVEVDEGAALESAVDGLAELLSQGDGNPQSEEDLALQVVMAQTNYGFKPLDRTRILYKALCKLDRVGPAGIAANAGLFGRVVRGHDAQLVLIGAVEMHYGMENPEMAKLVPLVLKALYDEELLSEETLIGWFKAMAPSEHSDPKLTGDALALVKSKAAVFVRWLEQEQEESNDSDSDSDSDSD